MANTTIKTGRPMSVPKPSASADFVLGSRPAPLRAPPIQRIKPAAPSTRDYGKKQPPYGGNTGMSGMS